MTRRALLPLLAALIAAAGAAAWCPASESNSNADALRKNMRDLWRASISAPKDPSAGLLRNTIAKLDATSASSPASKPAATDVASWAPTTTAPVAMAVVTSAPTSEPASAPAIARIDPNVLENLKKAPAQGAAGMLTLADSLFNEKELPSAYALYDQALKQDITDDSKGWALFQMGHCLQDSDANAAVGLYKRVSAEHPQCNWAPLAAAQVKMIDWRRGANMQAALEAGKARKSDGK